jgi:cytochrome c-type biogenesis protein CcmF
MIPELGHFALILALAVALAQCALAFAGAAARRQAWLEGVRPAVLMQALLVAMAFGCLAYAFVSNDFSVEYVAEHSNSHLPLAYRFAAVWGGHEGSILLWTLMLCFWSVGVALASRNLPPRIVALVLGVMGVISVGFLLFMLATSNPFTRLLPAAEDGADLNPLLQDPGMVFHPPLLYAGYVGFSVAFAFSIAALIDGRLDAAWARWTRPWTIAAWSFLTLGICLGSLWAYYVLGWGGWWFWDPVENASFMPWLVGTALIHSLAVAEKRGSFKAWTVLLAILAFSLSLLGTFLVRSGVLTSVHAFATDPRRGVFILVFLTLVVASSLLLFAVRAQRVGIGGRFELVSRETMLLANNVLLSVAAAAVLLGTLYPLALDALNLGKISVGPPYFDAVFYPLMAPAIILMGIGPLAKWKADAMNDLSKKLAVPAIVALLAAAVIPLFLGHWSVLVFIALFLSFWVVMTCLAALWAKIAGAPNWSERMRRLSVQSRAWYGMLLAHFGIAVFILGVTLVKGYEMEANVRMQPGDSARLAGHVYTLRQTAKVEGPNYVATQARIDVANEDGALIETLMPEKRIYTVQNMPLTDAAIDAGVWRHLFVSMGEQLQDGAWIIHIQDKPLVGWIWAGCLLMAMGGALAALDKRYRQRKAARRAAVPEGRPA